MIFLELRSSHTPNFIYSMKLIIHSFVIDPKGSIRYYNLNPNLFQTP